MMTRQARSSATIMGFDTHMILGTVPAPPPIRQNAHQAINRTSRHYAGALGGTGVTRTRSWPRRPARRPGAGNRPARTVHVDRRERGRLQGRVQPGQAALTAQAQPVDPAVHRMDRAQRSGPAARGRRAASAEPRRARPPAPARPEASEYEQEPSSAVPSGKPVPARPWPGTSNPAPHARPGASSACAPTLRGGGQYYRQELSEAPGVLPQAAEAAGSASHPYPRGRVAGGVGQTAQTVLERTGAAGNGRRTRTR